MNRDNVSILVISNNPKVIELVEVYSEKILEHDLSIAIAQNDYESVAQCIKQESIDLFIFDTQDLDEDSCSIVKLMMEKGISILFLISAENIEHLINRSFNFHLVDYLVKPMPDAVLQHKIGVYLENILQQKASEYLLSVYDENVIASKTDLKGRITYTSKAFCNVSEYSKEELLGKAHNLVRHPDTSPEIYKDLWDTIQSGKQWHGEIKNVKKHGGFYWVRVSVSPEFNYNGDIIGYSSIRQDITPEKYIEKVSLIDHLTQVYNKKYYDSVLEKEISSAARYGYNISLIMLDIDLFKTVNDNFGHQVGDSVLKEFADVLLLNTRKSDIVSRIGGEEFTIIVSNDTEESACAFARKLRKEIAQYNFGTIGKLTASIGITSFVQDDTSKTLFKRVDDAMYKAKRSGRNQVVRL
ncbi:MAG: diguanylate cyclase [Helicobacteraceae bacterium]|nr:diguanylate cyclase [Candidatus Sulfurimonas ponti]MBL6972778.1 diguanylate cyclase [Sulfurimonas sp.]